MPKAKEVYKKRVKNCLECGKEYKYFPYEESTTKFCSRSCSGRYYGKIKREYMVKLGKKWKGVKRGPPSEETKRKIKETHLRIGKKPPLQTGAIPWNKNKKFFQISGDKNHHWKGGTMKWARQQVRIRDNYTCQICGLREEEIIEVDHKKPIQKYKRHGFIDDINNMQCICPNCHRRKTNKFLKELNTGKLLKP